MPESIKVQNIICLDKDEKRKNKATPPPPPPPQDQNYTDYKRDNFSIKNQSQNQYIQENYK